MFIESDSHAVKYLCDEISEGYHLKSLLYDQVEAYDRESLINLHEKSFETNLSDFEKSLN